MERNWKELLLKISEPQKLFIYTRNGYKFTKGKLEGKLVKDVYKEHGEFLDTYLDEIYNHEMANIHTKMIIKDIKKGLKENWWV